MKDGFLMKFDVSVSFYSLCLAIGDIFVSWCDDSGARLDTPVSYSGYAGAFETAESDANFLRDLKSDNGLKVRAVTVSFPAVGEFLPEKATENLPVPAPVETPAPVDNTAAIILGNPELIAKIKEELLQSEEFIAEVIAAKTTPEVEAVPEEINSVPVIL